MSFYDPMHAELSIRGFWNPRDVDSIIRAVRQDHADRLFAAHQVATGRLKPEYAQTEHRVHLAILLQHDWIQPFTTFAQIHAFIYEYGRSLKGSKARAEQMVVLQLFRSGLDMVPRGVLEVLGICPVHGDTFGHSGFRQC